MTPTLSPEDTAFIRSLVLFEDGSIIAFNKPSGLSSQGGRIKAHTLDDLLFAFARSSGNRPRLIHRLDRDTSGVILTARTKPAAGFLGKAMMGRRFRKSNLAIVTPGAPEPVRAPERQIVLQQGPREPRQPYPEPEGTRPRLPLRRSVPPG
jgi:tRNA pseudouridine32 synthase/23S rRNA pseudouridine746 synthase